MFSGIIESFFSSVIIPFGFKNGDLTGQGFVVNFFLFYLRSFLFLIRHWSWDNIFLRRIGVDHFAKVRLQIYLFCAMSLFVFALILLSQLTFWEMSYWATFSCNSSFTFKWDSSIELLELRKSIILLIDKFTKCILLWFLSNRDQFTYSVPYTLWSYS